MELFLYLLSFIFVMLVILILYEVLYLNKQKVKERLEDVKNMSVDTENEDEWKIPFVHRILQPMYQKLLKAIGQATPNG
ncbi:MAG: hypothetical protein K0S47_4547, partial [Herbinix sp.]|nr:hypothetical protein [Herbinix sp.]